jgi:hypothetical protein
MSKHFIHYVNRNVYINKPTKSKIWHSISQKLGQGFDSPVYHVTARKTEIVEQIKKGDCIWLISELKTPWGKLPPSFDAKIVVSKIDTYKKGKIFWAKPTLSQWFPLANCNDVLIDLKTENIKNNIRPLISDLKAAKSIGIYTQSIRRLHTAESILNWVDIINKKPLHFISYRILDGTECAFNKVSELVNNGEVVFWDRWSLPRRLAERREKTSGKALNSTILKKIEESSFVWGIESSLYAQEKSYSKREYEKANELEIYKPVICPPPLSGKH